MSEITMSPCPFCNDGTSQLSIRGDCDICYVQCDPCGTRGPAEAVGTGEAKYDKAITAWNSITRRLKWTREKPTEEGFWFCRYGETVWVYWLTWDNGRLKISGLFPSKSERFIDELDEFEGLEWAGPIPEPEGV